MNKTLQKIILKYKSSEYWFPTVIYFSFVAALCFANPLGELPALITISVTIYVLMCLVCSDPSNSTKLWKLYTSDILSLVFHRQNVQHNNVQNQTIKNWCENNLNHKHFYFDRNLFITNSNDLMAYKLKWHHQL